MRTMTEHIRCTTIMTLGLSIIILGLLESRAADQVSLIDTDSGKGYGPFLITNNAILRIAGAEYVAKVIVGVPSARDKLLGQKYTIVMRESLRVGILFNLLTVKSGVPIVFNVPEADLRKKVLVNVAGTYLDLLDALCSATGWTYDVTGGSMIISSSAKAVNTGTNSGKMEDTPDK